MTLSTNLVFFTPVRGMLKVNIKHKEIVLNQN
ncbi:hypothetical protein EDC19_2146 [Natranaerovirga hydrolytica]|uniref:Uncharacterized protein n=1 Tax=Natranaerovirga hydrolytica TaxID=680378 RepID=A0A4V2Q053_9FIRM|nr:hypothetical protein EDC19_2146 [Natranaerovirga hydrolytica]